MEKVIRKKTGMIVSSIFFIGLTLITLYCYFFKKEFFMSTYSDFDIINGNLEIIPREEVNSGLVLYFVVAFIVLIIFLYVYFSWKLVYNENSFSIENDGIADLEYKDIISVNHYVLHSYRYRGGGTDKFIITYKPKDSPEYTEKREFKNFMPSLELRQFFNFIKEKNPGIEFYHESASSDGIEKKEFDYFYNEIDS